MRRVLLCLAVLALAGPASAAAVDYDAIVIGGGPGGLSAATRLAKRGRRVLIVEKRSLERTRPQIVGIKELAAERLEDVGVTLRNDERAHYADRAARRDEARATLPSAATDPIGHMSEAYSRYTSSLKDVEERLYDVDEHNPNIELLPLSTAQGAPTLDVRSGLVHVVIHSEDGSTRIARAPYLAVADGANSQTLRDLGIATEVYAKGRLAAAYWKTAGKHLVVSAEGVTRLGDADTTYTLTAIAADATDEQIHNTVMERGHAVGLGSAEPYQVNAFDTQMQRAASLLALRGHVLVIGDAAGAPHPFAALGINKALVEGASAADAIDGMLAEPRERARLKIAQRWASHAAQGIGMLHAASLPYYRKFGTVLHEPAYLKTAKRRLHREIAEAKATAQARQAP
jgi:2-polyprenyl-6-methoxyphenol hydroxylase-like FAD-dependent oxidoreductase